MGKADNFVAHINRESGEIQTVREHSENVAELTESFVCAPFKDLAYDIGLLHDVGKYQQSFQDRIVHDKKIRVDHSTCGAIAAQRLKKPSSLMAGYCIAGHHSGIPDGGMSIDSEENSTLSGRVLRKFEDFSKYTEELSIRAVDNNELMKFLAADCLTSSQGKESIQSSGRDMIFDKFAFTVRYLYSALVDADSLDTEHFCQKVERRTLPCDFIECERKVSEKLASFTAETDLQKARGDIQAQAFHEIEQPAQLYLMNMPTGSGKTICSVECALKRALSEGKERIIYIIPYNSIISQTAETFQKLFGDSASILRHQSTFSAEDAAREKWSLKGYSGNTEDTEDYEIQIRQATENWDARFIITTSVQFFESIYSNKKRKLRKLHNMANSVLIFDEVHMLPKENLRPCLEAVAYLTKYFNSTALFLTATMPDFGDFIRQYVPGDLKIQDLVPDQSKFVSFARCSYENIGKMSAESLLLKAQENASSLIIVNSRKMAVKLYSMCAKGHVYHLSTYMTAYDRQRVIDLIKRDLAELEQKYPGDQVVPDKERILVISTSLIEAGVDLDFRSVFREIAGVDNILQSGGRCNREGKRQGAVTYIFEFDDEDSARSDTNGRGAITRGLLKKFARLDDPECVKEYYRQLFDLHQDQLEQNAICKRYPDKGLESVPFAQYSLEMIDDDQVSIAVAEDDESRNLIQTLQYTGATLNLTRKLQKYTCSITFTDLQRLSEQNAVTDYGTGILCLTDSEHYYDKNKGVRFETTDTFLF